MIDPVSVVPREPFIPETIYRMGDDSSQVPVHRHTEPERWEAMVKADGPVVTQVKVEKHSGKPFWPTSSSSAPGVMREMLEVLDLKPGMRVLEIGTGTGWNAACMAEAGAHVVSIEIDPGLAEHARRALAATGYADRVTVVTGDGENGAVEHAPYDRVVATAAVHTVPYAWVEQTRDDGRIVVPYSGPVANGALLALNVRDGAAVGRAVAEATFMPMRGQRLNLNNLPGYEDGAELTVRADRDGTHINGKHTRQ